MSEPVLCRDCDRVCTSTRNQAPFKWRCMAHPIMLQTPIGLEYVDPTWRPDPPYRVCSSIRDTATCEHFTPRRTGAEQ